jgi:hypothetical protein
MIGIATSWTPEKKAGRKMEEHAGMKNEAKTETSIFISERCCATTVDHHEPA